jgi:uncharacterized protein (TIGR00369 family)
MTDEVEGRSRHYSWPDPAPAWERLGRVDGHEYLAGELRGEAPPAPITVTNRLRLHEVGEGRAVFTGHPGEEHGNAVGSVQGGWTTSLLDAAMGSAVHSALPAGVGYATVDIKVNFVRAIGIDAGELFGIGEVIHVGRRLATAEGRVEDADGRLFAHATTTVLVLPLDAEP